MDNIRKHLPFRQPSSGSAGNAGNADQSRSVFHMPLTNTPKMDIQQCRLGLAQYIATWNNFCGAGSHLSQLYKDILKDSEYAPVAGQLEERLGEMEHVTGNVSAQVKAELDKMLIALDAKLDRANLTPELTQEKEQVFVQCYLTFQQMQCQFFSSSAELLAPFAKYQSAEDLKQCQSSTTEKPEPAETIQGEDPLISFVDQKEAEREAVFQAPSEKDSGKKQGGNTDSPSSLRRQIHTFFNRLGQKPPNANQSLFYVDISQEAGSSSTSNQNQGTLQTSQSETSMGGSSQESGLSPVKQGAILGRGMGSLQGANGRQAGVSQEELDSVIDLLSGGQKAPMTPIPEIPLPLHPGLPPVGYNNNQQQQQQQINQSQPSSDNNSFIPDAGFYGNIHQHRRSDGLIAESTKDFGGRNTWPSNLQHRNSLPTEISQQPFTYFGETTPDAEFTNYIASITRQLKQACLHGNELVPPVWSSGDAKLNRSWPLNSDHNESENLANSWSGAAVQDSSSCSDESSCGETPFSMGIDLVSAMNNRRRHSSGEDGLHDNQGILAASEQRHKSVDDLHLEPKSTSTWPPKLSWSSRPSDVNPSTTTPQPAGYPSMPGLPLQQPPNHAQLRMQWSDPLAGPNPSPWGHQGLPPNLTSQPPPSFIPLPPGGTADIQQHGKVERKISLPT